MFSLTILRGIWRYISPSLLILVKHRLSAYSYPNTPHHNVDMDVSWKMHLGGLLLMMLAARVLDQDFYRFRLSISRENLKGVLIA